MTLPVVALAQQTAPDAVDQGKAKEAKGDLDGAIADFTRAIKLAPSCVDAYDDRSNARETKGDFDGAIADYNRAIQLDPNNADTYGNRGGARQIKGDLDGAIADFTHAIAIDPKGSFSYRGRGHAQFIKHNWPQALADFQIGVRLDPQDPYPHFFIWLIRVRLDAKEASAANRELAAFIQRRPNSAPGDWASKIAGFLLDQVKPDDFLASAASPDPKQEKDQLCEVWFYVGMKSLLSDDKTTAAADFQKCLATNEKTFTEYQFAQAELKALGPAPQNAGAAAF